MYLQLRFGVAHDSDTGGLLKQCKAGMIKKLNVGVKLDVPTRLYIVALT